MASLDAIEELGILILGIGVKIRVLDTVLLSSSHDFGGHVAMLCEGGEEEGGRGIVGGGGED